MRFFPLLVSALALALLLSVPSARAQMRMQNQSYGNKEAWVLFDPLDADGPVMFFGTSPPTPTVLEQVYMGRVSSKVAATVGNIVGRLVTEVSIITRPNGCSGTTVANSVETSNCVANAAELDASYSRLHELWFYPFYGTNREFCINAGGDQRTCLGPFKVATYDVDTYTILQDPDDFQLLFSLYTFLTSAYGPNADIPVTTEIDIRSAQLLVYSNRTCYYPTDSLYSFDSNYQAFGYDAYGGRITNVPWAFIRDDGVISQMRVLLRRQESANFINSTTSPGPPLDQFTVQLADAVGTGLDSHYFNTYWESQVFTVPKGSTIARVFYGMFGTPMALQYGGNTCYATFEIIQAPRPPQLLDPVIPSITNYAEPEFVPLTRTNTPRVCSFRIGVYDSNGFLKYPYCAELQMCGGYTVAERRSFPNTKENVEKDVGYAGYRLDCSWVYPKNYSFVGQGQTGSDGGTYQREVAESDSCLYPYVWPDQIVANSNPQERQQQCEFLGGTPFGRSQDACTVRRTFWPCRKGYAYAGQYCYWLFSQELDSGFLVPESEAQQACDQIEPDVFPAGTLHAVINMNGYELGWFKENFMYLAVGNANPHGYRLRSSLDANAPCLCFYSPYLPYRLGGQSYSEPCGCQQNFFPVCRYYWGKYEVKGIWTSMHSRTVAMFRDGQNTGTPFGGEQKKCECFLGSVGEDCERPTCVTLPDLTPFTAGFNTSDPLSPQQQTVVTFWQRCYTDNKGECKEGRESFCQCNGFYGPDAWLNSLLLVNQTFVCACPASSSRDPTQYYEINGQVILNSDGSYLPCGGIVNGACQYDWSTGVGVCTGTLRRNTAPNAPSEWEPDMGGVASTCPIPMIPLNGFVQDFNLQKKECSGVGTCCPISSPGVTTTLTSFTQNGFAAGGVAAQVCQTNGVIENGCECPTGRTGPACQCTGRYDAASGIPVLVGSAVPNQNLRVNVALVQLTQATPIFAVNVSSNLPDMQLSEQGCTATAVQISTSLNGEFRDCLFAVVEGLGQWACDGGYAGFVAVHTRETIPWCDIQAYSTPETYVACGGAGHGNPTAQAFLRYEAYRAPGAFLLTVRSMDLAAAGCNVRYPCICAPNYGGAGCQAGVSSVTISVYGRTTRSTCGYTTLPARGYYKYDISTGLGSCVPNPFTTADFTGKIAGETGGAAGIFSGPANECALYANADKGPTPRACGENGECLLARMPYGFCSPDRDDFYADPLSKPLARRPGTTINLYLQEFVGPGVLLARGRSWLVADSQLVQLDQVVGSMGTVCLGQTTSTPVAVSGLLSPESTAAPPQPAVANVTIWTLQVSASCTTTPTQAATAGPTLSPSCFSKQVSREYGCDPAVGLTDFGAWDTFGPVSPLPPACSTTTWCAVDWIKAGGFPATPSTVGITPGFQCIAAASWGPDPTSLKSQTLNYDAPLNLVVECGTTQSLTLSSSANYENLKYGGLSCNVALHRLIDWKLWELLGGTYKPQCPWPDWQANPPVPTPFPIGPYTYVLGAAYGLFWNQIPGLIFGDDWRLWLPAVYEYLSTVFNGYRCFGPTGLALQPLGEVQFDQYLSSLVNRTFDSLYTPNGTTAPLQFDHGLYTVEMLWAFGASFPGNLTYWSPAQLDVKFTPGLQEYLLQAVQDFPARLQGNGGLQNQDLAWYIQSVGSVELGSLVPDASQVSSDPRIQEYANLARDGTQQFTQDFIQEARAFARYYDPGVWQSMGGFFQGDTISVTFPANLSVFQVFNGDGSLCATLFGAQAGQTTIFTCSTDHQVNLTNVAANVTGNNLPYWSAHRYDLLWNETRAGPTVPYLMSSTLQAFMVGSMATAASNLLFRSVPASPPFWVTPDTPPIGITPGFDALNLANQYRIDPTRIVPQRLANGTTYSQIWDQLNYEIVVQRTWPQNFVYDALIQAANYSSGGNVICRPIDPLNPLDQSWLHEFYYGVLSPRRCTSDEECSKFDRNRYPDPVCVPDDTSHVPWLNGDPLQPNDGGIGFEGGCNCFSNSTNGFRDFQSVCFDCVQGWGPSTAFEWQQVNLYQQYFQSLLPGEDPASFMYQPGVTYGSDNGTIPYCGAPFDPNTDGLLCGGHGTNIYTHSEENVTLEVIIDGSKTPAQTITFSCLGLWFPDLDLELQLQTPVWDLGALRYAAEGSYLVVSVVEGSPYLADATPGTGGSITAFSLEGCLRPLQSPWTCDFVSLAADQVIPGASRVECLSPVLFDPDEHVDLVGYQFIFRDWFTQLVPLGTGLSW